MNRRLFLTALLCLLARPALAADDIKIDADVVYGHKDGMALTYDVLRPAKQNGAAVLWIQSGGWYSGWQEPKTFVGQGKMYLDKGFTLYVVRHGSAPKYAVPDAVQDVRRCVRAIRMKAASFGVDPERLGVIGGSAGGHLSLMLATTGDDGDPKATDEVLKHSSRVAAVVALYPPTDLRGMTTNPPEEIKKHAGLKPPLTFDAKLEAEVSPALKVTPKCAATLLIHGDKDLLVPLEHSKVMIGALQKEKVASKLVVVDGAAHGFNGKQNAEVVVPALMGWFETHLMKK